MKEVKFRAWDVKERRMFIPDGLKNPVNFTANVEHMQYTGLKDKNGVEIYEGDVLLGYFMVEDVTDWKWLQLTDDERRTGTVKLEVPDLTEFFHMSLPSEIEVIGNIYENPELARSTSGEESDV